MLEELKLGIERCQMQGRGVVAVSGGGDSVALLLGLLRLKEEFGLNFSVAHLNHQLRGAESDADAEWVRDLSGRLGLEIDLEVMAVAELAQQQADGIEETARKCRLEFLQRTAKRRQAVWIATGHHRQDQAETVLHHIIRGTGLAGLRGIPARRKLRGEIHLVRPLLRISHALILQTLQDWGENCRIDSSNSSEEFTRNRIRHQLLPLLEQGFNPRVVESLGRLADQAAEWEGSLAEIAGVFLQQVVLEQSVCGYRMRRSNWMRLPQVIQQEGLRQLWSTAGWPRQNMGAAHWERALEAIRNGGKQLFPGGVRMDVREDLVRIYCATEE